MIAAVWIMSALICIPPLLGWKGQRPEGDLPQCQVSDRIYIFFQIFDYVHKISTYLNNKHQLLIYNDEKKNSSIISRVNYRMNKHFL